MIDSQIPKKFRDRQSSKVYSWERKYVAPHDKNSVKFEDVQNIINYIWQNEGLSFPPKVIPLPKQCKRICADADRFHIRFQDHTFTFVIIHEISHSINSDLEGNNNWHNALFMGTYIRLLSKYMKMDITELTKTAREMNLKFTIDAVAQLQDKTMKEYFINPKYYNKKIKTFDPHSCFRRIKACERLISRFHRKMKGWRILFFPFYIYKINKLIKIMRIYIEINMINSSINKKFELW